MPVGYHFQRPPQAQGGKSWKDAVAKLPPKAPVKSVNDVHLLRDAKQANSQVYTVFRKWWDDKQHYDDSSFETKKTRAREYFNSFIDGTFRQVDIAPNVNAIGLWNEEYAASQSPVDVQRRVDQDRAFIEVWRQEYESEFSWIDIHLTSAAPGNDIPLAIAKLCHDHRDLVVLDYHGYTAVFNKQLPLNEHVWCSCRWMEMDKVYKQNGYTVRWFLSETGAVGWNVNRFDWGGWQHSNVHNKDLQNFLNVTIKDNLDRWKIWSHNNPNRFLGGTIFTINNYSDERWNTYELEVNHMLTTSDYIHNHTVALPPVPPPPIPPPPPQPPNPQQRSHGTDISHWQGTINWQKMKNKGVKYVFMKASEANEFRDPRFADNWKNAKEVGLLRSAYHFYRNNANPITQANLLVSQMNGDIGELPPVLDCEDTQGTVVRTDMLACLKEIEKLTGKKPIIYTGSWWWNPKVGNVDWAKEYDLWIAQYANVQNPTLPNGWNTWKFWQYSSSGVGLDYGVQSARIDLNFFNGTDADLVEYAKPVTWNKKVYLFAPDMGGWSNIIEAMITEIIPGRHDCGWSFDAAFAPQTGVGKTTVVVFHPDQWGGSTILEEKIMAKYGKLPDTIEYR